VIQYIGQICRYLNASKATPYDRRHSVAKAVGNGMRKDTWLAFQTRFGIEFIGEFYAATEGNAVLINNQSKVGAVGYVPPIADYIPCVNYPLKIIRIDPVNQTPVRASKKNDDDFRPCEECIVGEPGELISRIDRTGSIDRRFDGYVDKKATGKKILRGAFNEGDEWFRTGDLLKKDWLGYYYFVDRIGDTFRWRGENVATSQIAGVLHESRNPKVEEAVVYGVSVPNYDGRAGMACISLPYCVEVKTRSLGLKRLFIHCEQNLPAFAMPVFLRVRGLGREVEITSTFKHRKANLAKNGFDPNNTKGDSLYVLSRSDRTWTPLTIAVHRTILHGKRRL